MEHHVPYSGGAQGPSPLATLLATSSYHSSLVLPFRKAMTIMVMLSQPTPPVSELDAKQLSLMFSQILSRSCFAAIPRRTNSTTACDDWQSQIPNHKSAHVTRESLSGVSETNRRKQAQGTHRPLSARALLHRGMPLRSASPGGALRSS